MPLPRTTLLSACLLGRPSATGGRLEEDEVNADGAVIEGAPPSDLFWASERRGEGDRDVEDDDDPDEEDEDDDDDDDERRRTTLTSLTWSIFPRSPNSAIADDLRIYFNLLSRWFGLLRSRVRSLALPAGDGDDEGDLPLLATTGGERESERRPALAP